MQVLLYAPARHGVTLNLRPRQVVIPLDVYTSLSTPNPLLVKRSAELRNDLGRIIYLVFLVAIFLSLFFIPSLAKLL